MSKLSKLIGSTALGLALLAPALVSAQTSTTGLLSVYLQVTNQSGLVYSPANFTVSVAGNNVSPSVFVGSQSATLVSLNPGSFVVTVQNTHGYTASYSAGCNNSISAGQSHSCIITMTLGGGYTYPMPHPYPYPYTQPAFTCRTDTPAVSLGQSARFTAVGGVGGTYNWTTGSQNYPNVGPVLTTTFQNSGSQTVTVTNGAQSAICTILISTSYFPQPTNLTTPVYTGSPAYPYQAQPLLTSQVYPRFPNTGLAPATSAQIAFALVLLMGAAIAAYPYARKTLTIAVR